MKNYLPLIGAFLILVGCLPKTPHYPFRAQETLNTEAKEISDNLESYIKKWHKGEVSSTIPQEILPMGYDNKRYKNFRLVKPEELNLDDVWVKRSAHKINFDSLYGSFPDPNCTYLLAPVLYAPFGAQLKIKGEFPHCRFFDIQVSPALDTKEYRYDKWAGKGEVAIVDVDIEPLEGHINPFRVGANREAENRSYEVTYEMALGNPSKLNKAHNPPYRGKGNKRYGSAIQVQGPWGLDTKSGHGRGVWDFGDVWIRYYASDDKYFPDGGVDLPEIYFELPTGEQFFIISDFQGFIQLGETTMANRSIGNRNPSPYNGKEKGWDKQYGIFLQIATGGSMALYKEKQEDKEYVRKLDLGVTGRGENQPFPASLEPHATGCNYIGYLTSGVSIKKGKVFVLTGKLPTFPDTRDGAKIMEAAQCRYWSMTTYDADFPFSKVKGLENTSVMDDEIILDENRNYIIVYSRKEDRPANAIVANGITWIDWGNTGTQAFTWRWMSVYPDWSFDFTPNEENLPWAKTTWSGTKHDPSIIGNNARGFLEEYHSLRHYMTKEKFEELNNAQLKTGKVIWE
ncbi:MAG: hypothetical protein AAGJ12_02825 [Bacteroidota bacterium]